MDVDDLDPVELGVALSKLPPTHALVAAARAAVDVAELRAEQQRDDAEASKDMSRAWAEAGIADELRGRERTWRARAEFDGAGRATDEARAVVERLDGPLPPLPEPRTPAGAELRAETAAAVAMARQWLADQAAHEADLERRAQEARWVAADHAEEIAALEAAHTRELSA